MVVAGAGVGQEAGRETDAHWQVLGHSDLLILGSVQSSVEQLTPSMSSTVAHLHSVLISYK